MYATLEEAWGSQVELPSSRQKKKRVKQQFEESDAGAYVRASAGASQREDFANANTNEERKKGSNYLSTAPKDAYSGRLNDYTFGCKQYGVCPKTLVGQRVDEPFANHGPSANPPREHFENREPLTKLATKCAPLSAPNYEYPMSEQDKRKFKKAMDVALRENYASSAPMEARTSRVVDMSTVGGYGDDDLDQYLSLDNMQDQINDQISLPPIAPQPKGASTPGAYDPDTSPFAILMREAAKRRGRETGTPKDAPMWDITRESRCAEQDVEVSVRPPMWMDLLLFVSIGVLVILIMDQLFRLAMVAGMKQTLEILRPFLEKTASTANTALESGGAEY